MPLDLLPISQPACLSVHLSLSLTVRSRPSVCLSICLSLYHLVSLRIVRGEAFDPNRNSCDALYSIHALPSFLPILASERASEQVESVESLSSSSSSSSFSSAGSTQGR